MKRKFSFNMAPIKSSSKSDLEPTSSLTQLPAYAHIRTSSKDSISDYSPYISRRLLDTKTEHELRQACKLILQNFKPSDHGMEDTDPKLDFSGPSKRREHRTRDRNDNRPEPKVRMPTGAPVDLKTALEARGLQQTELTLRTGNDAPVRANSSRKRADFGWLDDRDEKRDANLRKSSSTRRKNSNPASSADTEALAWMRQQQPHGSSQSDARPSTGVRPPSRSRSIRDGIKEYVFPGTTSRSLSRAPSHESLRTTNTRLSQDSQDRGSTSGWRSWRRSGSRGNSRPGTSKGKPEEVEEAKKPNPLVVNLNRELPPLPSLDSWKEEQARSPPEPVRSPTSGAHIADLMRPQQKQQPATANRKTHRRSGSDTLATQYSASLAARSPTSHKHAAGTHSKTMTPDSATPGGRTLVGSASTSNLSHARHKSNDSALTPKLSGEVVNFSHKMSIDTPSRSTFSNEVKLTKKEEQKSRLKKVFSGWMTKKDKKDDWMQRIEKQGVKEGVMVHDGVADGPVVRY